MPIRRLALIPALWLALAGAAPLPSANHALVECRIPFEQALVAVKIFTPRGKSGGAGFTPFTVPADFEQNDVGIVRKYDRLSD